MRRLGAEEDLISLIVGMDPEEFEKQKNTLFNFDKQSGEIIGFKEQLQNVGRALAAVALGQYVSDQQRSAKESRNQVLAFNQLRAAGFSVAEAYEAIEDAAVASAVATGNVTRDQLNTMLAEFRNAKAAMEEAARLTPEGLQDVFEEGFNKAMETFDVRERKLTLEYELQIADDEKIIKDAQNQINAIRYQLDDYDADLRGIEDQENAINETYDKKLEALEKVRKANQQVLDQEKGKLSVAEAITRGDLAAAARAIQDVRQSSASSYFTSQTDALNAGRQSALDSARSRNGLSRIEVEERIEQLTNQIFEIEESALEPAAERVRLADLELEARLEEERVLGRTKKEWEEIKNNIDLARVNSAGYKSAMDEALAVVQDVLDAWNEIEKPKETIHTIITVREGEASGGYVSGGDGNIITDADTPAVAAAKTGLTQAQNALAAWDAKKAQLQAQITSAQAQYAAATSGDDKRNLQTAIAKMQKELLVYDGSDRKLYLAAITAAQNKLTAALNPPAAVVQTSLQILQTQIAALSVAVTRAKTAMDDAQTKRDSAQRVYDMAITFADPHTAAELTKNLFLAETAFVNATKAHAAAQRNLTQAQSQLPRTSGTTYMATGGFVSGPGTPTSDSVPAMLSNGEYVIKAASVDKFGTRFLDSVNAGQLPGYRLGGLIRDGGGSSKSTPKPVGRVSADAAERRALAAKPTTALGWVMASSQASTAAAAAQARQEAEAQRQRDALYKQGGFQGFEAGFGSLMNVVGKNPIVQAVGNYINSSPQIKSLIAAISIPVETIGAVAKNFIESGAKAYSQASQGDFIGAAGTMALNALTVMPKSLFEGTANAFAGVLDSNNARPSMFEQAGQAAYDANLFNAQNDPEMAALGRIIGGSLNIFADPLTYLGIGAVAKGLTAAKTAAIAGNAVEAGSLGVTRGTVELGEDLGRIYSTDTFQIGSNRPILFEGPGQDFSSLAGPALSVVKPSPVGLIEEALKIMSPAHSSVPALRTLIDNFKANKIGPEELAFYDKMQASAHFSDLGMPSRGDLGGLATLISSLAGDATAASIVNSNVIKLHQINAANKAAAAAKAVETSPFIENLRQGAMANYDTVTAFRSLKDFKVTRQPNGDILLDPSGNFKPDARSSVAWTLGGPVTDHIFGHFGGVGAQKIVTRLKTLIDDNGLPYNLMTNDTWWGVNPGQQLRMSDAVLATPNTPANHAAELLRRRLVQPGQDVPPIVFDEMLREFLYEIRDSYTEADRLKFDEYPFSVAPGYENMQIERYVLAEAAKRVNGDPHIRKLDKDITNDAEFNYGVDNLAQKLGIPSILHSGTKMADYEYLDPTPVPISNPSMIPDTVHQYLHFDSLEALRHQAQMGYFRSKINFDEIFRSEYGGMAKGGLVKPRFFANGGFVGKGTDTVPAMLSPGEYVIKSQRVKDLGTRLFDNINSGSLSSVQSMSSPSFSSGSSSVSLNQSSVPSRQAAASSSNSVYNYSLSVNVASQSDPNTIAQTVMNQLQRVDSQRIRNGRF
jgi:hypothetical protein